MIIISMMARNMGEAVGGLHLQSGLCFLPCVEFEAFYGPIYRDKVMGGQTIVPKLPKTKRVKMQPSVVAKEGLVFP